MDPLIIEISLNGQTPKSVNSTVPYSDDEIVEQAISCMDAGASLVHNHTVEPIIGGNGSLDSELYARPWRRLLSHRPDAILTPTMPVGQEGVSVENRYAHIEKLAEEGLITMGLCDPGSFNYAGMGKDGLFRSGNYVYRNDTHDAHYYLEVCQRLNIGVSISIFEPGFVKFIMAYVRAGKLPTGSMIKFYFGTEDLSFGLPPTEKALEAYLEMIEGAELPWLVSAFGTDCVSCGLAEQSIKRGGHVQVGLEPIGKSNRSTTNLELVKEVVALAKHCGRSIATPAQAAEILKLPVFPARFRSPQ